MITRRDFIKAGLAALMLNSKVNAEKETEADRIFRGFPEELPYTYSVKKYKTPEARTCLVHIIQKHDMDPSIVIGDDYIQKIVYLSKPSIKEKIKQINECQKDIYKIVEYLSILYGIRGVFHEGVVPEEMWKLENRETLKRLVTYIDEPLEFKISVLKQGLEPKPVSLDLSYMQILTDIEKCEKELEMMKERYKYYNSGVLRLYYEGKIQVYATEDGEILEKAKKERNKDKLSRNPKIYLDDREDIVLEYIAKKAEALSILVFGGAHAFGGKKSCGEDYELWWRESYKDNLYAWNQANPDKKFSLIEIIPQNCYPEGKDHG